MPFSGAPQYLFQYQSGVSDRCIHTYSKDTYEPTVISNSESISNNQLGWLNENEKWISFIYLQLRHLFQQKPMHILGQGLWKERQMSKISSIRNNTPASTTTVTVLLNVPFDTLAPAWLYAHCVACTLFPVFFKWQGWQNYVLSQISACCIVISTKVFHCFVKADHDTVVWFFTFMTAVSQC